MHLLKNNSFVLCIAGAVCILLSGCRKASPREDLVARVGNASLSRTGMETQMGSEGVNKGQESEFVDRWVSRELLYQEASRLGLDRSEELERELELVKKEYAIQKYLEVQYSTKISISDEEIVSYYEKNKDLFEFQEDEIRMSHILTKTRDEANLARKEILSGMPFKEVARERSVDEFKARGGDLGNVRRGDLISELSRTAFTMNEGAVSNVISSPFGFHVFRVEKKYPAGTFRSVDEVRDEVRQRIYVTKERTVYNDLIYELRNRMEPYISVPQDSAGQE